MKRGWAAAEQIESLFSPDIFRLVHFIRWRRGGSYPQLSAKVCTLIRNDYERVKYGGGAIVEKLENGRLGTKSGSLGTKETRESMGSAQKPAFGGMGLLGKKRSRAEANSEGKFTYKYKEGYVNAVKSDLHFSFFLA